MGTDVHAPRQRRRWREQVSQPHQIERGHRQGELQAHILCPSEFCLPHGTVGLTPAETLLDAFAHPLPDLTLRMARGAPVDG